eukprot:TRINITY_DN158_c0_g1_i1.p1 TRINITY_DN158_c0_g1~~TRINITY_DN158_c0_g1_i1.p1  ORF type:complete len:501 (+),score=10.52 TRINITY_DN158_c0_g1_i1:329-1831(+)
MKSSTISDNTVTLPLNASLITPRKSITLDEGYTLTGGHGRYQVYVAISVGLTMICSMWYLYCVPIFLSFPTVYGCKDGACKNFKEACKAPYYKYKDAHHNFITEFDLLCEEFTASLIPSAYPVGFLLGSLLFTSAADTFGRIPVLLLGQGGMGLSILVLIFFPSYNVCLVCTGICGFFSVACFFPSYSYAYDANHSSRVKMYAAFMAVSAAVGELMVALIMWFEISWRAMCGVFVALCFAYSVFPIILNEAPRYFYTKGHTKAARKAFMKIAKVNRVELESNFVVEDTAKTATKAGSFKDNLKLLFQRWVLLRILLCSFLFFTTGFVYYGISLNVEKFQGNLYLNAVLNAIAEIVADLTAFVFAHKIGLRKSLVAAFSIMTVGLSCQYASGESMLVLADLGLYIAKFGVSAGFTLVYTLAGELFPTAVISTAIGILGLCDRLGAMLSPIAGDIQEVFFLVAVASSIGSVIISFFAGGKSEEECQSPNIRLISFDQRYSKY